MNGSYQNIADAHNIEFDLFTTDQFTNLYLKEK